MVEMSTRARHRVIIQSYDRPKLYASGEVENFRVSVEDADGSCVTTGRGFEHRREAYAYADGLATGLRLTSPKSDGLAEERIEYHVL